MKALLLLAPLVFTSCMGTSGLVRQLAKDPSTAYIQVMTPYGNVKVVRSNPGTNTSVHVTQEGELTVERGVRLTTP